MDELEHDEEDRDPRDDEQDHDARRQEKEEYQAEAGNDDWWGAP